MAYAKKTIESVFKLYAAGMPIEQITKKTGVTKTTIYRWKDKYNWEERNTEIDKKVREKVDESISQIKARQRIICRGIQSEFTKQLQAGGVNITSNQAIDSMKHELHLVGEAESSVEVAEKRNELFEAVKELEEEEREKNRLAREKASDDATEDE